MTLVEDLRIRFRNGDVLTRIILTNIAVFLIINLLKLFAWLGLFEPQMITFLINKLAFAEYYKVFLLQPWSLFTYMFTHESFSHIFWNLIVLYWVGQLIIEYMGAKKLWAIYFLGGVAAAMFMWAVLNLLQYSGDITGKTLSLITPNSFAIGASGSINACLVAIATLIPEYTLYLILIGPVRLKYIAMAVILISIISIPNGNAGGQIAHIGGALFGYIYIKQLKRGNDIAAWFTSLNDKLFSKRRKIKVVYKSEKPKPAHTYDEKTIDVILDKISQSGYSSLTQAEKDILFNASDKKN
jgi:membrane associated rhomboid family serine protease